MEWKDDLLWAKNSHNNAQELYDYVINKPGLNYRNNSIHWVIPGKEFFPTPLEGIGGRAKDIGDKSWIFLHNVYQKHLLNADPIGTIMHEIGHCCGLPHPFPVTPSISGSSCIYGTTSQTYSLINYEFGNEVFWSVSPANLFQTASGCGNNFTLTPLSASNASAILTVTVNWGSTGSRTTTKNISLNSTQPIILGTYTYPSTSQNISLNRSPTPNPVPSSSMSVTLTSPVGNTFTWTKTSGPDNMVISNQGRNGNMSMTLNSMTTYNVNTSTACGNLSRSFTFFRPASSLISMSPNPANSLLTISAATTQDIPVKGDTRHFRIDPYIDKIIIYNTFGKPVYKFNSNSRLKEFQIDISFLLPGSYQVEIWDNQLNYILNLLIIK